jgi:hypothetical protein
MFSDGPVSLAADEPFHIRHGWGGDIADLRDNWHKEAWVTLAYTQDVDNPFAIDGLFVPQLTSCHPDLEVPGCQLFLFDFPEGVQGVMGDGFDGPVRFDMTWYGACGGLAEMGVLPECPEGIDEDRAVAALHRSLVIEFGGSPGNPFHAIYEGTDPVDGSPMNLTVGINGGAVGYDYTDAECSADGGETPVEWNALPSHDPLHYVEFFEIDGQLMMEGNFSFICNPDGTRDFLRYQVVTFMLDLGDAPPETITATRDDGAVFHWVEELTG